MIETKFFEYLLEIVTFYTKSMFGDIGIFHEGVMFALIGRNAMYIRGGGELDALFKQLNCAKYLLEKKQSSSNVNYYDVTELFMNQFHGLTPLIQDSIAFAKRQKAQAVHDLRLRDLPNLHFTIERMLKKVGIMTIEQLQQLGPIEAYARLADTYGRSQIDNKFLWKLAGAIDGTRWELLSPERKQLLLEELTAIA